jgi:putative holliday junction resolvase
VTLPSASETPRLLGVDYGRKRIGTAIADAETRIALPLRVVAGRNDITRDARAVADLGTVQGVSAFVVGLPLNMSDEVNTDSPQTAIARHFASDLERLSGKPVHLQDERLTTAAAEEVLDAAALPSKSKRRKQLTDMIAAQKILQAYLDAL